jgi:hypothetical protein
MELAFPRFDRGESQAQSGRGTRYGCIGYGIFRGDWATGATTPVNWEDGA